MPGTNALGRSALIATKRRSRGVIQKLHCLNLPLKVLRAMSIVRQSNLRKPFGWLIPRLLILVTIWGGVFLARDRSHRRQKGGICPSAARSMQSL